MSRPLAMSSFCALITGGSSAPSDGGAKITMVSFSTAWARASAAPAMATAAAVSASAGHLNDFTDMEASIWNSVLELIRNRFCAVPRSLSMILSDAGSVRPCPGYRSLLHPPYVPAKAGTQFSLDGKTLVKIRPSWIHLLDGL